MVTFIKLGGSLITDKRSLQQFHADIMGRVAREIADVRRVQPNLKLLIGHGSGSFGHVAAQKYGTMDGVRTADEWLGFAEVATVARRLNALVVETLVTAGLPIFGVQPSSSARCVDGELIALEMAPIRVALEHGLVPLIYGDVALDTQRGGTIISTETIFQYLAERLHPERLMLIGDVEGVFDVDGAIISHITPANLDEVSAALGSSRGTDVTGGMASKVRQMIDLVKRIPGLEVRIFGGSQPGQVASVLLGRAAPGTLITA
jgi:isopentenyl phosphate kinase